MIKRVLPAPIRHSRPPIFLARAPGDLRTESGKPPSRRLSLISFRFRVTIATLIGLAGSAAEISALLVLYLGHQVAGSVYVLAATILLVVAAAAGPAYKFLDTASDVYYEIKGDHLM